MAISEFEMFRVEKLAKEFCSGRNKNFPPDQLYIDYKLEDQTLFFFEVRPKWNDPSIKIEIMVAKIRYIKKEYLWKLYWQRQNMSWELYEPNPTNASLEPLLVELSNDPHECFWS